MEAKNASFRHVASIFIQVIRCEPNFDTEILIQLEYIFLRLLTVCRDDKRMDIGTNCLWAANDRLKTYCCKSALTASSVISLLAEKQSCSLQT